MGDENKKVELSVSLDSDTPPVVGREITPAVHLLGAASQHSLQFQWYCKRNATCCMHAGKKATVQCMSCVRFNLPLCDSCFCSTKCYTDSWMNHRERHPSQQADNQTFGEYKYHLDNPTSATILVHEEEDHKSWIQVSSSKNYRPSWDDFGCILRLNTMVADSSFPCTPSVLLTKHVTVAHSRHMIQLPLTPVVSSTNPQLSVTTTFRVISYNILAEMYAAVHHFCCPPWALEWEYRKHSLLHEIVAYDADIICLQEVQNVHLEDFFRPQLEQRGYSVKYKARRHGLYVVRDGVGRNIIDGCATFFRGNKFREVREYELVFPVVAGTLLDTLQPNQKKIGQRRLTKDSVAIVTILESVDNKAAGDNGNAKLCVANTHIHSNEDLKDVKLWQVATLINGLEKIGKMSIPVLLCGDLNSEPGSAPHDLVVKGKVDRDHVPDDPIGIFDHLMLSHGLRLVSAYSALESAGGSDQRERMDLSTGEPRFTHWSYNFSGTLDYIFYSGDKLSVKGVLELVEEDVVKKNTAIPSAEWPSDHIAVGADLCLQQQNENNNVDQQLPVTLWDCTAASSKQQAASSKQQLFH